MAQKRNKQPDPTSGLLRSLAGYFRIGQDGPNVRYTVLLPTLSLLVGLLLSLLTIDHMGDMIRDRVHDAFYPEKDTSADEYECAISPDSVIATPGAARRTGE